jgi:hypothetical protein
MLLQEKPGYEHLNYAQIMDKSALEFTLLF